MIIKELKEIESLFFTRLYYWNLEEIKNEISLGMPFFKTANHYCLAILEEYSDGVKFEILAANAKKGMEKWDISLSLSEREVDLLKEYNDKIMWLIINLKPSLRNHFKPSRKFLKSSIVEKMKDVFDFKPEVVDSLIRYRFKHEEWEVETRINTDEEIYEYYHSVVAGEYYGTGGWIVPISHEFLRKWGFKSNEDIVRSADAIVALSKKFLAFLPTLLDGLEAPIGVRTHNREPVSNPILEGFIANAETIFQRDKKKIYEVMANARTLNQLKLLIKSWEEENINPYELGVIIEKIQCIGEDEDTLNEKQVSMLYNLQNKMEKAAINFLTKMWDRS